MKLFTAKRMAFSQKNLIIKKSTIPGAGLGLFTRRPILKGTFIIEYKGRISPWKKVNSMDGANPYIMYVNRNHVIDALSFKKAKAKFANDARGLKKIKGKTNNSVYIKKGLRVYIQAKKNIEAGSEILVNYGKDYWDAVKYNRSL